MWGVVVDDREPATVKLTRWLSSAGWPGAGPGRGRNGVAALIERHVTLARRLAAQLASGGVEVLNEVRLNQVVASFGDDERTNAVISAIQRDGTCWCGPTAWRG